MIQRVEAGRELAKGALSQLGQSLPELLKQGVTSIVIDTSKVVEFDSGTLEAILEFEALAKSRGLAVVVDKPSSVLFQALYVTGIADRVPVQVDGAGTPASRGAAPTVTPAAGSTPDAVATPDAVETPDALATPDAVRPDGGPVSGGGAS